LKQAHHLVDPDRALIRSALRGIDPPQPGCAIELRQRVEERARARRGIERQSYVGSEIGALRSLEGGEARGFMSCLAGE
jgi:hypothetical protein